jgi:hypothetical protein
MRRRLLTLVSISAVAICGCAVQGLHDDQDRLRSALVALCTNQVMDNLVRASNGLPIIQLDYTNANTQFTVDVNASLGETGVTNRSNTITALALSSVLVTRTLANTIAEGLGFSRTHQVAVTATPVTTNNQVYDAYIAFLTIPGSLQITCSPPPPGAAHVCRRFRDEYYWVPLEFRDRYVELASITTAQRGKSLLPSDDFYSVNIVGLGTSSASSPNPNQVLVKVDQPVPISTDGLAVFENGRCVRITRFDLEENNRFDFVSDQFYLNFDSAADKASLQFPSLVRLYLEQPPPRPTTKELVDRIPFRTPQVAIGVAGKTATNPGSTPPPPSLCPKDGEGRFLVQPSE